MSQAKPIITDTGVEAYVASALHVLAWLLGAILRLGLSGRSARLKHLLSRAELNVECILFLKAVARYGPAPQRKRHPRSVPPGFRRISGNRRLFFRGAKLRAGRKAGALQRVLAMFDALAHPDRGVGYFFKRICNGLHFNHFAPIAPPAHALACDALSTAECAYLDTS